MQNNTTTITDQQIRQAAETGVKLLSDPEIRVPADVALSGNLQVLVFMLRGLASGECVLTNPPTDEKEGPQLSEVPNKSDEKAS